MDEAGSVNQSLIRRIEEVERERDDLRKDIEQLCLHQAGPSFLGVATRMHLQRTAGLEQEIDNLKRKLAVCTRENRNLQEELSEAYRIKGQLADLYSAEASKNIEIEKQVKFFQGCIASAFSERDHALMESEKAKEHEESILQDLNSYKDRYEELESACTDLWRKNSSLQTELLIIKDKIYPLQQVVSKFYEIRQTATGCSDCEDWNDNKDKCSCLLDDSSEMWSFDEDRNSSTSKYIASLEERLDAMRKSMESIQNKMQLDLEIEHHLKRKIQSLEKQIVFSIDIVKNGLSALHDFHSKQKSEILCMLEEENVHMTLTLAEMKDRMSRFISNTETNTEVMLDDQINNTECKDLHVTCDADFHAVANMSPLAARNIANDTCDTSDALAMALKEKVAALLLLSQQEERHLLERDLNSALQLKIEELQKSLFQVTHEKVKALMELADLKRQFQVLQENCNCISKHGSILADGTKVITSSDGKLKDLLKRTYLRRWIGKGYTENEFHAPSHSDESVIVHKNEKSSTDLASLNNTIATIQDTISNIEHLTSSVRKLRLSLLKARSDAMSMDHTASLAEALAATILEANHIKTALGSSLPANWSSEASDAGQNLDSKKSWDTLEVPQKEKLDPAASAGFEMAELLVMAAELLKEIKGLENSP